MTEDTQTSESSRGTFIEYAGRLLSGTGTPADLGNITRDPEFYSRLAKLERWQLLPFLFSVRGKPYSLTDYPQFKYMYGRKTPADTLYKCGRQIGKCVPIKDLCTLSDGTLLPAYKIRAGDSILALNSDYKIIERRVTAVFDNGVQDLLELTTRTGHVVRVTPNHRLKTLLDYKEAGQLVLGDRLASMFKGGLFKDRHVPEDRIIMTAYLLGDGHIGKDITLTAACPEIILETYSFFPDVGISPRKKSPQTAALRFSRDCIVTQWMREDNLIGTLSDTKFIPDWVFQLSRKDTALFISRLWATDGSIKKYNTNISVSYSSCSLLMIEQLRSLLNKFGIASAVRHKEAWARKSDGTRIQGKDAHELRIETQDSLELFRDNFQVPGKPFPEMFDRRSNNNADTVPFDILPLLKELFEASSHKHSTSLRSAGLRLKAKYPPSRSKLWQYLELAQKKNLTSTAAYQKLEAIYYADVKWDEVVSMKMIPAEPTLDIEVEVDHNYVMDGVVSHNSTNLSRSEIMDCIQMPNLQVLYVAPLKQQSDRYAQLYLKDAINTCKPAQMLQAHDSELDEGPVIRSVSHQAFSNGSGIQTMYAKTSADRARGITADVIDYDEIQDQLIDHLPIIAESITNSEWQVQRYCGTAKTTDNTIEYLWQQTSRSEWGVKCSHCNYWNIPDKEHNVLAMIHTSGPVCAKCRGVIDPRDQLNGGNGSLVHAVPDKAKTFLGVHVPQIFVPAVYMSPLKWSKLIHKVTSLPESIIYTEILGISHDAGLRLITQEDIDRASTLGTHEEIRSSIRSKYRYRICGVDWGGGADITSFTVSAVIGITNEGQIDVLFAKRYAGVNIEEVIMDITRTFRAYECDLISADFGGGFTNNSILANRGVPMSQVQYVRSNSFLRFSSTNNLQRWMVDRNTALNLVFWAIKYGKIHFPNKQDSAHYTSDLLSPYEHLRELTSGMVSKVFLRNPSIPDDFCHALVFAALMGLQLAGDKMLSIVPETAMEYTGSEFPEGGITDVGGMLNFLKGKE